MENATQGLLKILKLSIMPLHLCRMRIVQAIDIGFVIQRRMTCLLPGIRGLPYEQRLKALNMLTMHARRIRQDLIMAYEMINGLVVNI